MPRDPKKPLREAYEALQRCGRRAGAYLRQAQAQAAPRLRAKMDERFSTYLLLTLWDSGVYVALCVFFVHAFITLFVIVPSLWRGGPWYMWPRPPESKPLEYFRPLPSWETPWY